MSKTKKEHRINDKQKIFVEEFVKDFNASRAYQVAYGTKNQRTAEVSGSRLLKNAEVQKYKHELIRQILGSKLEEYRFRVQNELILRSFIRVSDLLSEDAQEFDMNKVKKLPLGIVKKISIANIVSEEGEKVTTHNIEFGDNHKPLELLGKTVGSFNLSANTDIINFLREIDLTQLTEEQLTRISNGESPLEVLFGHYRRRAITA